MLEGVVLIGDEADGVEGADRHADVTTGAGLVEHVGLRDLLGLVVRDDLADLILDGEIGAPPTARTAVDASIGIDDVELFLVAGDRVGRTLEVADRAARAELLSDGVRQVRLLDVEPRSDPQILDVEDPPQKHLGG
jgi:hypothetical protein